MEFFHETWTGTFLAALLAAVLLAVPLHFGLRLTPLSPRLRDLIVALDFAITFGFMVFILRIAFAPESG